MGSDFYIVLDKREKPKFDAHFDGILLDEHKEIIPVIFNKGRCLKDFPSHQFYIKIDPAYSETGKLRDKLSIKVNTSSSLFVVSKDLELVLKENAPDQLEFFKVTVQEKIRSFTEYKIANILCKINCIDYQKSDLEFEYYDELEPTGDVITTHSLSLDELKLPPYLDIFLLDRYKDPVIVLRETLKNAIEERNISGFVFCKVGDFKN